MALLRVYALADRLLHRAAAPAHREDACSCSTSTSSRRRCTSSRRTRRSPCCRRAGATGAGADWRVSRGRPLAAEPYAHVEAHLGGVRARVVQRAEFGSVARLLHCWTAPDARRRSRGSLLEAGARARRRRSARRRSASRRACPWYGMDVDDTVILPETRAARTLVSYHQGLLYRPGGRGTREVPRPRQPRALRPVLEGDRCPPPGARVVAEGKEIGRVTSAVRSLALGVPIALGYVRREHFEPGTPVAVGRRRSAHPRAGRRAPVRFASRDKRP